MVFQTLSESTSVSGQYIDILLRRPINVRGWETKAESGPHRVQISGDVSMPCFYTIMKHP